MLQLKRIPRPAWSLHELFAMPTLKNEQDQLLSPLISPRRGFRTTHSTTHESESRGGVFCALCRRNHHIGHADQLSMPTMPFSRFACARNLSYVPPVGGLAARMMRRWVPPALPESARRRTCPCPPAATQPCRPLAWHGTALRRRPAVLCRCIPIARRNRGIDTESTGSCHGEPAQSVSPRDSFSCHDDRNAAIPSRSTCLPHASSVLCRPYASSRSYAAAALSNFRQVGVHLQTITGGVPLSIYKSKIFRRRNSLATRSRLRRKI